MDEHWNQLLKYYPHLSKARILDLGAGKGKFLIAGAKHGVKVTGLEYNPAYIEHAHTAAREAGVEISIEQGEAEALPYAEHGFDFVHANEVVEHVADPRAMMREVYRVLRPGGVAYVTVPNRFGVHDPHFHLYFVNWLPRVWSDAFIGLVSRHKQYTDVAAGHQRLADMHYFTYRQFKTLAQSNGFTVADKRLMKIDREYRGLKRVLVRTAFMCGLLNSFLSAWTLLKKSKRLSMIFHTTTLPSSTHFLRRVSFIGGLNTRRIWKRFSIRSKGEGATRCST